MRSWWASARDKHLSFHHPGARPARPCAWLGANTTGDGTPQRLTAALRPDICLRRYRVLLQAALARTPGRPLRVSCAASALGVRPRPAPDAERRDPRALLQAKTTPQRPKDGGVSPWGARDHPQSVFKPDSRVRSPGGIGFVPGFPPDGLADAEWVLDTQYRQLFDRDPLGRKTQ